MRKREASFLFAVVCSRPCSWLASDVVAVWLVRNLVHQVRMSSDRNDHSALDRNDHSALSSLLATAQADLLPFNTNDTCKVEEASLSVSCLVLLCGQLISPKTPSMHSSAGAALRRR